MDTLPYFVSTSVFIGHSADICCLGRYLNGSFADEFAQGSAGYFVLQFATVHNQRRADPQKVGTCG